MGRRTTDWKAKRQSGLSTYESPDGMKEDLIVT